MRSSFLTGSFVLLILAAPLHAQEMVDDSALASLPLDDEFPALRPQTPRAATQPTTQPTPEEQKDYLLDDPRGARTWLIDHGITPGAKIIADTAKNLAGGRSTRGSAFDSLLNFSLSLDTEKLLALPGGTLYFNLQQQHGASASDEAGTLQNVSSITADGRTQLSEAWYQQALLNKKWLIKAGKIDVGGDFAFSDFGADFLNAAMMIPASDPLLPTYPDSAFGIDTFLYPCDHFYLGLGAFDGALAADVHTGENGPRTLFGSPSDTFLVAEAGVTWQITPRKLSGRLKLGALYQTSSDLPTFAGGSRSDALTPYLILDQKLLRFNPDDDHDDRGLGLFFLYDHADPHLFDITDHLSTGLSLKGPCPARSADTLGLGFTYARLSPDANFPHDAETAVETFYKVQLTPYLTVQPDLQYILNPATTDRDHALIASLRVQLTF